MSDGGNFSQVPFTAKTPRHDMIRVLVADDHVIVRKGICALLATEPGITVVAEACNGQEAISQAQQAQPDVILMDLVMPGMDGLEATRQLTSRQPQARILVLTSFQGDDKVFPAIKAGAFSRSIAASPRCIRPLHANFFGSSPNLPGRYLQQTP
jgi:CheY-like chemotaxis protein